MHIPFLAEAPHSLDQKRKSLGETIPDVARLQAQPHAVLAEGPIVIGPAPQPGLTLALGFLLLFGVFPFFVAACRFVLEPLNLGQTATGWIGLIASAVPLVLFFRFVHSLLHDARLVLTRAGVEIHDRRSVVFCPWSLFRGASAPLPRSQGDVILPVNAAAVCLVETRRGGDTIAEGFDARNRYFHITPGCQAILADRFSASTVELGTLLFEIGRRLGADSAVDEGHRQTQNAAAMAQPGGWLRVGLSHLAFPPICCGCQAAAWYTVSLRALRGRSPLSRLAPGRPEEAVVLSVPFCKMCVDEQRARRRRYERWFTVAAATVPLLVFLPLYLVHGHDMLIFTAVVLAAVCGTFGRLLAVELDLGTAHIVAARNLCLESGTVEIWFRDPTYATLFLAFVENRADRSEERK